MEQIAASDPNVWSEKPYKTSFPYLFCICVITLRPTNLSGQG